MHLRSLSLAWVVSLLLLLAQHGALLHQLGHLSHPAQTRGATPAGTLLVADLQAVDSGSCFTCEAFAQIANPAAAHTAAADVYRAAPLAAPEPCYGIVSCDAPTPRSRGPP